MTIGNSNPRNHSDPPHCRAYKKYFLAVFSSASSCISHEKSRRPVSQAADVPLKLKAVSAFSLPLSCCCCCIWARKWAGGGIKRKGPDCPSLRHIYVEDWVDQEASICWDAALKTVSMAMLYFLLVPCLAGAVKTYGIIHCLNQLLQAVKLTMWVSHMTRWRPVLLNPLLWRGHFRGSGGRLKIQLPDLE